MANESLGQLLLDGRVWCEGGELESHHIRCVAKLLRLLLVRTRPVPVALHRIALKRRALGMVLCDGTSPDKAELLVKGDRRHRRLQHDELKVGRGAQLLEGQAHQQLSRAQAGEQPNLRHLGPHDARCRRIPPVFLLLQLLSDRAVQIERPLLLLRRQEDVRLRGTVACHQLHAHLELGRGGDVGVRQRVELHEVLDQQAEPRGQLLGRLAGLVNGDRVDLRRVDDEEDGACLHP
mmetsp:Transcript_80956/g.160942  ORF Transcript_80956/g.160942 Transcript_80956/m.160942 type:complete len:235 (-) Transcript_80956:149-853(-)